MTKFDGIKKRFGKIEKEIEDKELAKIGTKDLERIVADINQMKVDINLAKEQARENLTDVSIDDLGAIFKESEEMWTGMSALLETVEAELATKQEQVDKLTAEVARQNAIVSMYEQKIASYSKMIRTDERKLNDDKLESELLKLVNDEHEFESKKVAKLQELLEKHVEVSKDINVDINALKYGGELRKKTTKKDKVVDDWDSSFKDGNRFAKEEELDDAFANGLTKDGWDKSFVGGTDNLVGAGISEDTKGIELDDPIVDGDLAELIVPDLGDGVTKESKEIIPVKEENVEATTEVELTDPIPEEVATEVDLTDAIPEEVSTEVDLTDAIPEEVATEVELTDAIPEEVSTEVNLTDAIPEEVATEVNLTDPIPEEVATGVNLTDAIPEETAAEATQETQLQAQITEAAAPAATVGVNPDGTVQDINWDKWDSYFITKNEEPAQAPVAEEQNGPSLTL